MSPTLRRWLPIGWRVLVAVAGAFVVVMLAGDERGIFRLKERTLFWAAVTLAGITFLDSFLVALRRFRQIRRDVAEARVQKALVSLLVEIADVNNVRVQHLGASVFVPRRRLVRTDKEVLNRRIQQVLVRVMRFRLDEHPQRTPITWARGKGAVGSCWTSARTVHRPWHLQAENHSSPELSRVEFEQIEDDLRDNFTHREFVAIANKYSEVLAVPVLSEAAEIVGIISIDVAHRAGIVNNILNDTDIEAQADAAATLIRDDLRSLSPQN